MIFILFLNLWCRASIASHYPSFHPRLNLIPTPAGPCETRSVYLSTYPKIRSSAWLLGLAQSLVAPSDLTCDLLAVTSFRAKASDH
ncbi:hypothetical protein B0H11DRAFT_2056616 [Mycena galericulata]|nr:hypothetical protein B0H11DRAFT_2056616 [Mycena galericulata]